MNKATKNNSGEEQQLMFIQPPSQRIRVNKRQSTEYTIFLDDEITEPSNYRDEIFSIINSSEFDEISIILNTVGGSLSTALAFKEVLQLCPATSTAVLIGECSSAGTIIALACNNVAVLDSATFMIHTAKFGSGGTTNNVKDHVDFTHAQINKLIDSTYVGFLSKAEIEQVKLGKEFWFNADEIRERLQNRAKYFEQLEKKKAPKKSKKDAPEQQILEE